MVLLPDRTALSGSSKRRRPYVSKTVRRDVQGRFAIPPRAGERASSQRSSIWTLFLVSNQSASLACLQSPLLICVNKAESDPVDPSLPRREALATSSRRAGVGGFLSPVRPTGQQSACPESLPTWATWGEGREPRVIESFSTASYSTRLPIADAKANSACTPSLKNGGLPAIPLILPNVCG